MKLFLRVTLWVVVKISVKKGQLKINGLRDYKIFYYILNLPYENIIPKR